MKISTTHLADLFTVALMVVLASATSVIASCSSTSEESADAGLFPPPVPPECVAENTGHLSVWNTGGEPLRVTVEGTHSRSTVTLEPNVLGPTTSLELDLPVGDYRVLATSLAASRPETPEECVPIPVHVGQCEVHSTLVRCP